MFEIGDKVVCVDDSPHAKRWQIEPLCWVVEGETYVVRGFTHQDNGIGITLVGIFGGVNWGCREESGWNPRRFRKLSDMQAEARERRKERQPA